MYQYHRLQCQYLTFFFMDSLLPAMWSFYPMPFAYFQVNLWFALSGSLKKYCIAWTIFFFIYFFFFYIFVLFFFLEVYKNTVSTIGNIWSYENKQCMFYIYIFFHFMVFKYIINRTHIYSIHWNEGFGCNFIFYSIKLLKFLFTISCKGISFKLYSQNICLTFSINETNYNSQNTHHPLHLNVFNVFYENVNILKKNDKLKF